MKTMAIVFSLSHIAFLRNPGEWNTIVDSTIWIHDAQRDLQNFSIKMNIRREYIIYIYIFKNR